METQKTYTEISKSQRIRLVDVFILGPGMLYLALSQKKIRNEWRFFLGFFGATTIGYNAYNYYQNLKIPKGEIEYQDPVSMGVRG